MNTHSFLNISLLIFLALFISACNRSIKVEVDNSDSNTIEIHSNDLSDYISELDFINSVDYIPLESLPTGLIGNVTDLKMRHGKLYILDRSNQSIHEFDQDGNHIKSLMKRGDGPEEYNEILNFSITDNELVVNDMWEVLHYSLQDFSFKKYYTKELVGFKTYVSQSGFMINHQLNSPSDNSPYNITVYDYTTTEITDQKEKVKNALSGLTFSQKNHFYTNIDQEYFTLPLNDTIYKLENGKLQFHKFIDFQDIKLTIEDVPFNKQITSNDIINQNKAFFVGNYLESSDYTTFSFTYNQRRFKYLMNKAVGSAYIFPSIKQVRTPLLLPIDYYVLNGSTVYTYKDIEEAKYELSQVEKGLTGNQEIKKLVSDLKKEFEGSSLLILKINLKQ